MSEQVIPQVSGDEKPQNARHGGEQKGRERGRRRHHQPQQAPQRKPETSLNMDELRDLVELIAAHGFTDFELEREGIRVRLRRELAPQIVNAAPSAPAAVQPQPIAQAPQNASVGLPAVTPHPGAQAEAAASEDEDLHIITSPIVGTFYRSPSPTAESFVKLGSKVEADSVVCIIEAMKLMNEIQAETDGEIAKIYVENGQPVEFGQPLFGIRK
jgi:acetyl-CoA carboxylase biotin carboxyl carrier protein